MSLRTYIQDHPTPLVWAWEATAWTLRLVKPVFAKMGMETSSKVVKVPEEIVKGLLFNCQDCAQCMLHYNGMTCPMNCPKNLRNGPCGGVRLERTLRGQAGDGLRVGQGPRTCPEDPLRP